MSDKAEIDRRALVGFAVIMLLYGLIIWRMVSLSASEYAAAGRGSASRTLTVAQTRGTIYDTNGERLTGRESEIIAAVRPTLGALDEVRRLTDETQFAACESSVLKGKPALVRIKEDPCHEDVFAFNVPLRYDGTAQHIIGYTDGASNGVSGIEKSFDEQLKAQGGELKITFEVDALGRVFLGSQPVVSWGSFNSKAGIVLTLDRKIQLITEQEMDNGGIDSGAAVVLNAKTGAVEALVSRPTYDAYDVAASLDEDKSPLVNKSLGAHAVGSVFKAVVAAAAIESGVYGGYTCTCTGQMRLGDTVFGCNAKSGHGEVDLSLAMKKSCNIYFIGLAQKIDTRYLCEFSRSLGFSQSLKLCDGITSDAGVFPLSHELTVGEKANLAFGQGRLTASPLQLAAVYLALTTDGEYRYPYLIKGQVDGTGMYSAAEREESKRVLTQETSEAIRALLVNAAEHGAADPGTVNVGGKTATAQSGIYDNGREICRTWFAGFFPAEEPEHIVVLIMEDGISGSKDCAPVFARIADEIYKLNP